jgi:hypothetical protein
MTGRKTSVDQLEALGAKLDAMPESVGKNHMLHG